MIKIILIFKALLANVTLAFGMLALPTVGTTGLKNYYSLVWLILGLLIILSYFFALKDKRN